MELLSLDRQPYILKPVKYGNKIGPKSVQRDDFGVKNLKILYYQ